MFMTNCVMVPTKGFILIFSITRENSIVIRSLPDIFIIALRKFPAGLGLGFFATLNFRHYHRKTHRKFFIIIEIIERSLPNKLYN